MGEAAGVEMPASVIAEVIRAGIFIIAVNGRVETAAGSARIKRTAIEIAASNGGEAA